MIHARVEVEKNINIAVERMSDAIRGAKGIAPFFNA